MDINSSVKNSNGKMKPATSTNDGADFETAIAAAGFGYFNILLLFTACLAAMSSVFETSVISYILPSAECDLKLTLIHKGILNAITYAGMILSAVLWGYLSDTKGRRNLLIFGYLTDVLCVLGSATSQSVTQLMIFKFLGGFISSGPLAILMTYLGEFHGNQYRARVLLTCGIMFSLANICLPVLALIILPNNWNLQIFHSTYHSWHLYLAICSIPSFLSGLLFCLFPESPQFLLSKGRNEEALNVFRIIFSLNTRQLKDNYPFKKVINEYNEASDDLTTNSENLDGVGRTTIQPIKAMLHKPYLQLSLHVYLLGFCILFGQNTMRLWLPQLFASFYEYEQLHDSVMGICSILEFNVNKTNVVIAPNADCIVVITTATYKNNIIIAVISLINFIIAICTVNIIGPKRMQVFALFCAGCCGIGLYWSSSSLSILIITSIYNCMTGIASTSNWGYVINLFPTFLRTIIVSTNMMFGRIGSIVGNVLFPVFMSMACIPSFLMFGFIMFVACTLTALLPNTKAAALT